MPCPHCRIDEDAPELPAGWRSYIKAEVCQRCQGVGYVCAYHTDQPMDHRLKNGRTCPNSGIRCTEPGCPGRQRPN